MPQSRRTAAEQAQVDPLVQTTPARRLRARCQAVCMGESGPAASEPCPSWRGAASARAAVAPALSRTRGGRGTESLGSRATGAPCRAVGGADAGLGARGASELAARARAWARCRAGAPPGAAPGERGPAARPAGLLAAPWPPPLASAGALWARPPGAAAGSTSGRWRRVAPRCGPWSPGATVTRPARGARPAAPGGRGEKKALGERLAALPGVSGPRTTRGWEQPGHRHARTGHRTPPGAGPRVARGRPQHRARPLAGRSGSAARLGELSAPAPEAVAVC